MTEPPILAGAPMSLPDDVADAIERAFGVRNVDEASVLKGGLSGAALFDVRIGETHCVVRKVVKDENSREFECMKIAAERGVAPKLFYADRDAGIAILEKLETGLGPPEHRARDLARTLRLLHAGPTFPETPSLPAMFRFLDGALRSQGQTPLPAIVIDRVDDFMQRKARFATEAPCHRDLNPNNILRAGDRLFFIDWDTAGRDDPFFDLAELGVFAVPLAADRGRLLAEYLEREPREEDIVHAALARVVALGFYYAGFHLVAAVNGTPLSEVDGVPLAELQAKIAALRERTPPSLMAASLLVEMNREAESDVCRSA